jgi:transaldolase / glucose-6-phosphate isomerase
LIDPGELVARIWERDPTVWTGRDEASWLGWLDEPIRMRERVDDLLEFATTADFDAVVLLGMGGSSLAPEVLRRLFEVETFRVLDTTHPAAIRRLEEELDFERTLVVVASKSGTTLETRCHLEHFWARARKQWSRFVAITDPGTELEQIAAKRGFQDVFPGEPTIGGRYSALSVFGLVPAVLMGLDLRRLLERAEEMREACRLEAGNPGLDLGLALGEGWTDGRDKVLLDAARGGFGLWAEQLLAESTGKEGKGLVPVLEGRERPGVQVQEVRLADPYEVGQEFFRWEFATAVAGSILGINPFDQPNVQEAKDRTNELLARGAKVDVEPAGSVDDVLAQARDGDYVSIQAFVDPAREPELDPLLERARETGCVVTHGLGPRYLHSTGQLHKGGPPKGVFVQVVDDPGEDVAIPGRKFGFRALIQAQAAGDFRALAARGRPIARVRLEDL